MRKWNQLMIGFVLLALLVGVEVSRAEWKIVSATNSEPAIVLMWFEDLEVSNYTKFNITRRTQTGSEVTTFGPLGPSTNCSEVALLIPVGSRAWQLLRGLLGVPLESIVDPCDEASIPVDYDQFDPCEVLTISVGSDRYDGLIHLARLDWRIAALLGHAYYDASVTANQTYIYELKGIQADGSETAVLISDTITAATTTQLAMPSNLISQSSHSSVLLYWDNATNPDKILGYNVYRADALNGTYTLINESSLIYAITKNWTNDWIRIDHTAVPSFIDFQHWACTGKPLSHMVNGVSISGPTNGITYYYKVASVDALFNVGILSGPVSGSPVDTLRPASPTGVNATANNTQSRIEIQWSRVTHDVEGHVELQGVQTYEVYRYDTDNGPDNTAVQVASIPVTPTMGAIISMYDGSPDIRSEYGEKTFWYRVEAIDVAGNISFRSTPVSGYLTDVTPPSSPTDVEAQGEETLIQLEWTLNSEPDMEDYQIYRSFCNLGNWEPCLPESLITPPCSGPFLLMGTVSHEDAMNMGVPYFEDTTIPEGSPICYAYLIKARDHSQNMSGDWPRPDESEEEIVCERLHDVTPPGAAIISGLLARDNTIIVEWIAPPVQDIAAYYVYRSLSEGGMTYTWVGGMTVEVPPATPQELTARYSPPAVSTCDEVPLHARDDMSIGSYWDTDVDPHRIYWYKVVGIDQNGNEANRIDATPVSSFTFSTDRPDAPAISDIAASGTPCAITINWLPGGGDGAAAPLGYAIFRGLGQDGPFHQLGSLVSSQSYRDTTVLSEVEYWYRVLRLETDGKLSPLSLPESAIIQP